MNETDSTPKIDTAVRVIVSSGYSNDPVMADYREYGFDGRILKPYEFEPFIKAVAAVLNSSTVAT